MLVKVGMNVDDKRGMRDPGRLELQAELCLPLVNATWGIKIHDGPISDCFIDQPIKLGSRILLPPGMDLSP